LWKAIWTKNKTEVKKEEYQEFYQSLSFDNNPPLDTIHVNIEGAVNYKAILFIPQQKNPFQGMMQQPDQDFGPSLYVQNVLIMEKCKDLLPQWLRFAKGVIETPDLPLNVSRELLQNSAIMQKIQSSLVKEVIKSLSYIKKNKAENYQTFFQDFGQFIKEGVHSDFTNKEKLAELLTFHSLLENKPITIDEYISSVETHNNVSHKEKKNIYYIIGKSLPELLSNPYLEQFKNNKVDVLLMDSPLDERVVASLPQYKEYTLKSATSSDIHLGDQKEQEKNKKESSTKEQENKDFLAYIISTIWNDKIEKVQFGHKGENTLGIFIAQEGQPTAQMEKIMKAMGQEVPPIKRTLELNINNPLVNKAIESYNKDPKSTKSQEYIKYFYDQAILLDGGELENTNEFINRINTLLN